ncbi:hypothetical protein QVD17_38299 [Tagetes erecta]|uniref:Uncharacterized protein n=1 Tax=Tagetes erecta TaxID=13708 RepID=A0AAD8JQ80_TARER|nr:hypothetical protein QVD17_38299 [Tagetes erecta]
MVLVSLSPLSTSTPYLHIFLSFFLSLLVLCGSLTSCHRPYLIDPTGVYQTSTILAATLILIIYDRYILLD